MAPFIFWGFLDSLEELVRVKDFVLRKMLPHSLGYNFRGFSDLLSEAHLCTCNAVSSIIHSANLMTVLCAIGMPNE